MIKIAKIAAQCSGNVTSDCIQNYGIRNDTAEGRKALFKIAKIAARSSGEGISKHIQNYGFRIDTEEGRKALFEIAKCAAEQDAEGTLRYLDNYGIFLKDTKEGQRAWMEIAKIAAYQNGENTLIYTWNRFKNEITEEEETGIVEIAKIAIREGGWEAFLILEDFIDFSLEGKRTKEKLAVYALGCLLHILQKETNDLAKQFAKRDLENKMPFHLTACEPFSKILLSDEGEWQIKQIGEEAKRACSGLWENPPP